MASQRMNVLIRSATHKLNFYEGVPGELFDLQADPDEFCNRLDDPDCASVRAQLEAALNQEHPELFARTEAHLAADRRRRKKRKPQIVLMETD